MGDVSLVIPDISFKLFRYTYKVIWELNVINQSVFNKRKPNRKHIRPIQISQPVILSLALSICPLATHSSNIPVDPSVRWSVRQSDGLSFSQMVRLSDFYSFGHLAKRRDSSILAVKYTWYLYRGVPTGVWGLRPLIFIKNAQKYNAPPPRIGNCLSIYVYTRISLFTVLTLSISAIIH